MRYKPAPRHPFEGTLRKRAALRRKQQRERDALPLFAKQVAQDQPDEDEVMQTRADASALQEARDRHARAQQWREARRRIDALPYWIRRALRVAWNCAPYPGDPSRLLGMLGDLDAGKLDLGKLPFALAKTDGAGTRINDIRETDVDWRFISILTCRDIAASPDMHSVPVRRAAYAHLQAGADANKDRQRGMQDRVLAAQLWLRMGELDGPSQPGRARQAGR